MDARTDTPSARFGGQWAFLSSPPAAGTRSLPHSSSYLRSDRSNISPLPTTLTFHQLNASQSSLPRHARAPSTGGRSSTTTAPSQPVLVRVHSADPILQIRPSTRPPRPRRKLKLNKMDLPPLEAFSIRGILAAIAEDIEEDVDAIAEILGRSRLVLADQHDSHMPPQGEIRAALSPLQAVAEASSSNERLAVVGDEILILREDASLVEGSHTGSAAYGLLERLQTLPRTRRMISEIPGPVTLRPGTGSIRHYSAPPVIPTAPALVQDRGTPYVAPLPFSSRQLLQSPTNDSEVHDNPSRTTKAVVSETYLSAGANATTVSDPPVVSEGGRHYPLYSFDYTELFEGPVPSPAPIRMTLRERIQSLIPRMELPNLASWVHGQQTSANSAESQLREILHRQPHLRGPGDNEAPEEDPEMYG
ncbi:hypothetical protein H2200_000783 [Cladophialophora chaetospira]|uniref:Uncharacterized protein n=1 Tax=Cladophialophora chaetospira TaxID=386627 RepID=A0AA38XP70_9EURO|nr:hypothetical protein H2200_000783 [Cladophialophora chaetospira]